MTLAEAYSILGCKPDDTSAVKRKAYAAAAKRAHPDINPKDPTASAQFRQVHAAWQMVRNYAAKPNGAERNGGPQGEPEAKANQQQRWNADTTEKAKPSTSMGAFDPRFLIRLVNTIAGGGKTRLWAQREAKRFDGQTIIAAPTRALILDIERYLKEQGCHRQIVVIDSDHKRPELSVTETAKRFLNVQHAGSRFILIVSHTIGAEPLAIMSAEQMQRTEMTFDEIPDVARFMHFDFPDEHWLITQHMVGRPFRDGVLRIEPADFDDADPKSAWKRLEYYAMSQRFSYFKMHVRPFVEAVLDPQVGVFVLEDEWKDLTENFSNNLLKEDGIDFVAITSPEKYALFKSTTLMGARADHGLSYKLWQSVFLTHFTPHPIQAELPLQHYNGSQITLWYAFEGRTSRSFLDSKKSTTDDTMFNSLAILIADFYDEFYPDEDFVWTAPIPAEGRRGVGKDFFQKIDPAKRDHVFKPELRLPGRTHGLNEYRHFDHAVLLSVINPNDSQKEILMRLGIPEHDITDTFGLQILYQDLLRISIREPNAKGPQSAFVMDKASADNIATMFNGIAVKKLPAAYIPDPREPQKRGPKPTGNAKSGTERSRKSRSEKAARDKAFKESQRDRAADE